MLANPDLDARLKQHRPLVRMIAFQLTEKMPAHLDRDEMLHVGMIGLWQALTRFDERPGVQFKTFASKRIRGAMLDELHGTDWLYRCGWRLWNLDVLLEGDGSHPQAVHLIDPDADPAADLDEQQQREVLFSALDRLPDRDQRLMTMRYEQDMDFKSIGAVLGMTSSGASQAHGEIVDKLRALVRRHAFEAAFPALGTAPAEPDDPAVPADDSWMQEYADLVR